MLAQDEVPFGVPPGTAVYQFISASDPDSLYGKIWSKSFVYKKTTQRRRIKKILEENIALLGADMFQKGLMQVGYETTGNCDLAVAREPFLTLFFAVVGIRKGSPVKAKLNEFIQNLLEFGILDQWVSATLIEGTRCFTPPGSGFTYDLRPLSLKDFYGIFLLYSAGVGIAFFMFLLELAGTRRHRKNPPDEAKEF